MVDPTLPLPGLSPIAEKAIVARFDGGRLSSDGGLLVLRQIERRLSVADRLAACIDDPRDPASTVHTLADIIRFRLLMIAAGYEDVNDATGLRLDPLFKMALERLPSERDLCSQSTISRLENLPDARTLLRLGRALVDLGQPTSGTGPSCCLTRECYRGSRVATATGRPRSPQRGPAHRGVAAPCGGVVAPRHASDAPAGWQSR